MSKFRSLAASLVIATSALSGVAVVGVNVGSLNTQTLWCCR